MFVAGRIYVFGKSIVDKFPFVACHHFDFRASIKPTCIIKLKITFNNDNNNSNCYDSL